MFAGGDGCDGAATDLEEHSNSALAVRFCVEAVLDFGDEFGGEHDGMASRFTEWRNKKSPPSERTPATGSCGYLVTGAADTLSTVTNLAQVVAHFQEEKFTISKIVARWGVWTCVH